MRPLLGVFAKLRAVQELIIHGRNRHENRGAVNEVQGAHRVKLVPHEHVRAREKIDVAGKRKAVDMKEGQHVHEHVVRRERPAVGQRAYGRAEIGMRVHHALGLAGSAGRVKQQRPIVSRGSGQRGRGLRRQREKLVGMQHAPERILLILYQRLQHRQFGITAHRQH